MTTLREAAQQALEALGYKGNIYHMDCPAEAAITALRAALAQEEQEPCTYHCEAWPECWCADLAKPAQEEQEAVQIKPPNPEGATQCIVRWMVETPAGWVGAWDREALQQFVTPPRRECRSLSEEEIAEIWYVAVMAQSAKTTGLGAIGFARAVEAALRSKNHE